MNYFFFRHLVQMCPSDKKHVTLILAEHMMNPTVSQCGWSCVWGCPVLWGVTPCCSSCLWWERVVQASLSAKTRRTPLSESVKNTAWRVTYSYVLAFQGEAQYEWRKNLSLLVTWLWRALNVNDQQLMDCAGHAWSTARQSEAITFSFITHRAQHQGCFHYVGMGGDDRAGKSL